MRAGRGDFKDVGLVFVDRLDSCARGVDADDQSGGGCIPLRRGGERNTSPGLDAIKAARQGGIEARVPELIGDGAEGWSDGKAAFLGGKL